MSRIVLHAEQMSRTRTAIASDYRGVHTVHADTADGSYTFLYSTYTRYPITSHMHTKQGVVEVRALTLVCPESVDDDKYTATVTRMRLRWCLWCWIFVRRLLSLATWRMHHKRRSRMHTHYAHFAVDLPQPRAICARNFAWARRVTSALNESIGHRGLIAAPQKSACAACGRPKSQPTISWALGDDSVSQEACEQGRRDRKALASRIFALTHWT